MKRELQCVIRGKVQGVMFRDFAQRKARSFNIVGTVQNQADGSVKVIAVGEENNLKKLLELLYKGPLLTRARLRVDGIESKWGELTQDFSSFEIIY